MFCPHCGFEYTQKTNFCKSCGGNLGASFGTEAPRLPRHKITTMFWAITTFGIAGLLADFITYYNLAHEGLRGDALTIPFALGLIFTAAVVGVLVWQLARIVSAYQEAGKNVIVERHFIREAPPTQIGAPTDPIQQAIEAPSVVEHTTRRMAGVYRGPAARE